MSRWGVLLAELEVRHTRAVVPVRRVALGDSDLPVEPAPGHGGLLLAAVVASVVGLLNEERRAELDKLIRRLERGQHIAQPSLRYRFQTDVVGLDRSHHRLVRIGRAIGIEIDDRGNPLPQALAACYAAARLPLFARPAVFRLLRRATRWEGGGEQALITFLQSSLLPNHRGMPAEAWALEILGFASNTEPARTEILTRFRNLIRDAHPDHGAETHLASERITELSNAKRILIAS